MKNRLPPLFFSLFLAFGMNSSGLKAEGSPPVIRGQKARPQPKSLTPKAEVIVEWQEILDSCAPELICVHGNLYNQGSKTAKNVKLRVEIGAMSLSKPRVVKYFTMDESLMKPGDRQEFYFELERKTPYKDYKGNPKIIEVGKFNFRIVPSWTGKTK